MSGFVVWLDVLGSRLSGYRLAELLTTFGDELTGVPPAWVGLAWYLFPLVAAVSWLFVFLSSPASAVRAHVPMGVVTALAAAAYLLWVDSQLGPWLAFAGGTAVFTGGLRGSASRE